MSDATEKSAVRPRRRHLRRWIIWPLVALLLLAFAGGWWITRPHRLKRIVTAALADAIHADVTLTDARLVWTDGLYLTGLRVAVPDAAHGDVFAADQVLINPAWLSLLIGSPAADDIVLVRPTFYLTEDLETGQYLFQRLATGDDGGEISRVPRMTVREGRVIFREIDRGELRELGALVLEGQLATTPESADDYRFVLHEVKEGASGGAASIRGTFNTSDPRLAVEMNGFKFEQPQRFFLRHELRQWWSRLDPQGAFSTLAVSFDPAAGWSAQLVLDDAALNVPLGDYVPRMTGVIGRMRVEGHSLLVDHLEGDLQGLRYRVSGRVEDVRELEAARFSLTAETDWFHVEPDPAVVEKLPRRLAKYHARFQPEGDFRLSVHAVRDTADGPIRYDGQMHLANASGRYHKFSYPGRDVHGLIRFNTEEIVIERLEGRGPGDVRFAFESGRISPPGDGAAVRVAIRVWDMPIDDLLRDAMEPEHRQVLDLFLREDVRQRLIDDGLLDPAWTLGGVIPELHVAIDRPEGDKVHTAVTSTLRVDGLRTIYEHWPYPMTVDRGTLTIAPQHVDVDMRVAGPTGARGRVVGSLARRGDEDLFPDLRIEDAAVPIDGLLIRTLPQPQDAWVRDLHVHGTLRGNGRITQKEGEKTGFQLRATLDDATAQPFHGRFALDGVAGDVLVERGRFTIHSLTGTRGDTGVSLTGMIDWADEPMTLNLAMQARDLVIEPAVLDLLPPDNAQRAELATLFERYQPTGRADLAVDYRRADADTYRVVIDPRQLAVQLPGGGASFTDMTGRAVVERNRIHLERLTARFDDNSSLAVNGSILQTPPAWAGLLVSGEARTLGPTLRAILPQATRDLIASLQLDGAFTLTDGVISQSESGATFKGDLAFEHASLSLGLPVTQLQGSAKLLAEQRHGDARPRVALDLHADSLLAADRRVSQLDVRIASDPAGDALRIHEFLGSIYGGALVGEGTVRLGEPARYAFDLTLEEVELGPFLHPESYVDEPVYGDSPQRTTETGLLSANLSLGALTGKPASRLGRGAIEVRHAKLYNQPIPLAILQTLNLTLPVDRSFESASARVLIDGDHVLFDTIRFDAPSLSISGAGTLDWPTQALDLEMVTRNPGMPDLGAVGEVINKVKDELIAIRITGTLTEPVGRAVSLSGLRRSWDQLFSTKAARPPARIERGVR